MKTILNEIRKYKRYKTINKYCQYDLFIEISAKYRPNQYMGHKTSILLLTMILLLKYMLSNSLCWG